MQDRYSRQSMVPEIGSQGQQALRQASVLLVGAGGLGCTVATHLAGAGIGKLLIVDHDTIDISNLHRQILFREDDLGQSKAGVAAREIKRLNSECDVSAIDQRLSTANQHNWLGKADIVVDAADNFAVSYLLSDACFAASKPLVSASVNRTFGYVGQFCHNSPSLRAIFPRLPLQQANCDTVGVTGPSVGVIASLQAQEVIKAVIGDANQLRGKLLYLDVWRHSQQLIDFNGTAEPQGAQLKLLGAAAIAQTHTLIDVREQHEVEQQALPFAHSLHIPLAQITSAKQQLAIDTPLVCACRSGQRAISAAQQLLNLGFTDVAALIPD